MARGDYTVQEVEAAKQAGRDSSYRTCILTMFIFLLLCIILLVISWTTLKPASEREAYSQHSFQKYSGQRPTSSLATEPPFHEFEKRTTVKTYDEKHTLQPIVKTTGATGTSATTRSDLNRLVALETVEAITTKIFTTSPAVTATTTTTTTTTTNATTAAATTTTTNMATKGLQSQLEDSTDFTTDTSTKNYLKQQVMYISSATTTEKPLTQSKQYNMTKTTRKGRPERLIEQTTIPSTAPVTNLETEQPVTTISEETSTKMDRTNDDKSGQVTGTQTRQVKYTVPHIEESEQPSSTTSDVPVRWRLRTTPMLPTDLPDTTQRLEYKTTPNLTQAKLETSATEDPVVKDETTGFVYPVESTEITLMTTKSDPGDRKTKQRLVQGKQSTDIVTSSTLHSGTDSSVPLSESVAATTVFERDATSHHNEPKMATVKQLMSTAGSHTEAEDPVKNMTTPATDFANSSSFTDSASVNNQSVFTTNNESTISYISTPTAFTLTATDRSTTPYKDAVSITDTDSTISTNLLTPSSSFLPHIQPIYTLVTTDTSTDSTYSTAMTSAADDTDATESFVSDSGGLSSQSISTVSLTDVSRILTTTDGSLPMSVTEHSTAAVTESAMPTQHRSTASDETTMLSPSQKSAKIISNATVTPEQTKQCTTSACKVVASRMLSLMNHSADPCEDFYEYACGGLRENRNLLQRDPENEVWTRIGNAMNQISVQSPAAFMKLKNFYHQCLMFDSVVNKTSRLEEIRKVLDGVGKMYNHTEWAARNLNLNLTSLLVKLFQLNSAPLFDVQLDVDVHNTSRFAFKLTAPTHQSKFQPQSLFSASCKEKITSQDSQNVNLKDVYLNIYLPCTRDYSEYMNVTEKALKELGMFRDLEPLRESQYIKDSRFFIEFHILHHLTVLPLAGEMRHSLLSKHFTSLSVDDLQDRYSLVNWKTLLNALVGNTVDPHTTIQLYFDSYFESLFDHLGNLFRKDDTNRMKLHNALLSMFAHDLYVDLVQTQSPCSREDYCLRVASGLLEDASSALYLSTLTKEQMSAMELDLQTLFTQLKSTLNEQFQVAGWLDNSTRSYLTSKLQKLTAVTDGGRVFLGDSYLLNQRLSDVDVTSSNSYLQNAVQLVRRYRSGMYSLYHTEPNLTSTIWTHFLLPYDTQAVAVYPLNVVVIPFGLIGSPQSTPDLPEYIFKARIGNDLARQIAHHFDTTGIEYGSSGKDMDFLSDSAKNKYKIIQECDEMTYSFDKSWTNHKHQVFTYKVETPQSMNGRFADNSALQLSYKTYTRNTGSEPLLPWLDMNHDKLYHMLVAQEFCTKQGMLDFTIQLFESEQMPPFLRVTNLAQHSEDFSEAYGCGRGTQMNPEVKCYSFPELKEEEGYGPDLSPQ